MTDRVKHWVLEEMCAIQPYNSGVDKVIGMVWASIRIQYEVPVNPTCSPVPQLVNDITRICISSIPATWFNMATPRKKTVGRFRRQGKAETGLGIVQLVLAIGLPDLYPSSSRVEQDRLCILKNPPQRPIPMIRNPVDNRGCLARKSPISIHRCILVVSNHELDTWELLLYDRSKMLDSKVEFVLRSVKSVFPFILHWVTRWLVLCCQPVKRDIPCVVFLDKLQIILCIFVPNCWIRGQTPKLIRRHILTQNASC
mmetsp:Transcript_10132/g.16592  ORF Transcript_10132/g.16592 Transcript_10132/m.16592 type:complete len:255 (+) Transcript_10132:2110-2874(+)